MGFEELRKVIHLSHTQNLHQSALALDLTVGALSKFLKKIETQLSVKLFDRVGRHIVINEHGQRFCLYAQQLVHEYDQMCSEFNSAHQTIKVAGPAILLSSYTNILTQALNTQNQTLKLQNVYEGQAIELLAKGQIDIALVTHEAKQDWQSLAMSALDLGQVEYQVFVAQQHPLSAECKAVAMKKLLTYPFVCPERSPFCGVERGIGSDNWPDHHYARNIAYRSDDLQSQLSIMNAAQAISYLPSIVGHQSQLIPLQIQELASLPTPTENICLVYKPSMASGWLSQFVTKLSQNDM